ncbi:MAG: hypothetical protein H6658_02005 [Ardenticatenaceae bacterium]|nr:hypothetical protein [Ardenticatenaceae bacterium]
MNKLVPILKNLKPEGKRLNGGLALRITRGNGMTVLGCSRVEQAPSEIEMKTVMEAVIFLWQPSHIWRGHISVSRSGGEEHHIWRLYWPIEKLEEVYAEPVQEELPLPQERPFPF